MKTRTTPAVSCIALLLLCLLGATAAQAQGPQALFASFDFGTATQSIVRLNPDGSLSTLLQLPPASAVEFDYEISGNVLTLLLRTSNLHLPGVRDFSVVHLDCTTGVASSPVAVPQCVPGVGYGVAKIRGGYVIAKAERPSGDDLILINPTTAACTTLYSSDPRNQIQNNFFLNQIDSYDLAVHPDGSVDVMTFGRGDCADPATRSRCSAMAMHRHLDATGSPGPIDFFTHSSLTATGANPFVKGDFAAAAPTLAAWVSGEVNPFDVVRGVPNDVLFFRSDDGAPAVATPVSLGRIAIAQPRVVDAVSGLAVFTSVSRDITTRQVQLANARGAVATLETTTATGFFSDALIKSGSPHVGTLHVSALTPAQSELKIYTVREANPIKATLLSATTLSAAAVRLLDFSAPPTSMADVAAFPTRGAVNPVTLINGSGAAHDAATRS